MMTLVSFRLTEDMIDRSNKREKDVEGKDVEGKRLKVLIVCEKYWKIVNGMNEESGVTIADSLTYGFLDMGAPINY